MGTQNQIKTIQKTILYTLIIITTLMSVLKKSTITNKCLKGFFLIMYTKIDER